MAANGDMLTPGPRPGDRPALRLRRQLIIERSIGIPLVLLLILWVVVLKTSHSRACLIRIPGTEIAIAVRDEAAGSDALDRFTRANAGSMPLEAVRVRPQPVLELGRPEGDVRTVDQAVDDLQAACDAGVLQILADAVVMYADGAPVLALRTPEDADIVLDALKQQFTSDVPQEKIVGKPRIVERIELKQETRKPSAIVTSRDQAQRRLLEPKQKGIEVWVGPDDTAEGYARRYGVSRDRIAELNPGVDLDKLKVGQHLIIKRAEPQITVEFTFEETVTEDVPFKTEEVPTPDLKPGERKVQVEGRPGRARVRYLVTRHNDVDVKRDALDTEELGPSSPQKVLVGPAKAEGQ